jgi:hypothetical protein
MFFFCCFPFFRDNTYLVTVTVVENDEIIKDGVILKTGIQIRINFSLKMNNVDQQPCR